MRDIGRVEKDNDNRGTKLEREPTNSGWRPKRMDATVPDETYRMKELDPDAKQYVQDRCGIAVRLSRPRSHAVWAARGRASSLASH